MDSLAAWSLALSEWGLLRHCHERHTPNHSYERVTPHHSYHRHTSASAEAETAGCQRADRPGCTWQTTSRYIGTESQRPASGRSRSAAEMQETDRSGTGRSSQQPLYHDHSPPAVHHSQHLRDTRSNLSTRPHCANTRRKRYREDLNSFTLGELKETTMTTRYYMDED